MHLIIINLNLKFNHFIFGFLIGWIMRSINWFFLCSMFKASSCLQLLSILLTADYNFVLISRTVVVFYYLICFYFIKQNKTKHKTLNFSNCWFCRVLNCCSICCCCISVTMLQQFLLVLKLPCPALFEFLRHKFLINSMCILWYFLWFS